MRVGDHDVHAARFNQPVQAGHRRERQSDGLAGSAGPGGILGCSVLRPGRFVLDLTDILGSDSRLATERPCHRPLLDLRRLVDEFGGIADLHLPLLNFLS